MHLRWASSHIHIIDFYYLSPGRQNRNGPCWFNKADGPLTTNLPKSRPLSSSWILGSPYVVAISGTIPSSSLLTRPNIDQAMAGAQCCENPPVLSSSCGAGAVEEIAGLKAYVAGSAVSRLAVLLVSDVYGIVFHSLRVHALFFWFSRWFFFFFLQEGLLSLQNTIRGLF